MTDKDLTQQFLSSPQTMLADVVKHYSAYVYKIVLTRLADTVTKQDIEEAVSDVFVKLYTAAKQGVKIRSVGAYLSVIAQRHCIDLFRKSTSKSQDIPLDEIEDMQSEQDVFAQSSEELTEAIKALGEPDTQIFIRRYFFGQRNKDIAKELGMNTAAVNKRISRGLQKLRKILEEGER